jgi:type II secretory pathway component PulF
MLVAGIPILEAVDSLIEDAHGSVRKVLLTLAEDLAQGKRVYETFSRFPNIFDKVTTSVIKAAEEAGSLEVALADLKVSIRKEMEFNDKIKSAMVYPVIILLVFLGVLLMILIVVVPKISAVFGRLNVTLPLPTRIMIFLSDQLLKSTGPTIGVVCGAIIVCWVLLKTQRALILRVFFAMPLVRSLVKEIDLTRFTRSIHLLLTAGLPITAALDLTQDIVLRRDIRRLIVESSEMMMGGEKLSEGLRKGKGLFPAIMIKLIEVGEKTGSLDKSMQDISEYLDYEVTNALKNLTVVLEPIMLVVVGGLVGAMMLAIIAPIYGLIGQVGGPR